MDTPTPDQEKILDSKASTILIDAIAGSGKTTTLAMLVRQMRGQGVNPRRILCLAFSQGAKIRLSEKLQEYGLSNAALLFTVDELARYHIEKLAKSKVIRRPEQLHLPRDIRQHFVSAADRLWKKIHEQGRISDFNYDFGLDGHC
ncbi:UvrD-helicase domain-containing protein [uncultured Herbaspirillum sp.]|uniref:UvrD-helicase domain-containing protein n=1 Tax=uncultured Herbaspirillum sp. TaxID=160236 RepID=UPI00258317C9|nr:UvrD-helicase domain-containing protein [uncultured Herbaspirillum sp.]